MKFFAPKAAGNRRTIDYASSEAESRLVIPIHDGFKFEEIRKEVGHCNIAPIPPGLDISVLELWENDRRLGPGNTLHDEVRTLGSGRYHIGPRSVYFSSSDGTDAQINQRTYELRPR